MSNAIRDLQIANNLASPIDIMIDIETVGVRNNAGIWQIGAVNIRAPYNTLFQYTINPEVYHNRPHYDWDTDTLSWQTLENNSNWNYARSLSLTDTPNKMANVFAEYIIEQSGKDNPVNLWSKGKDFDFPILEHLLGVEGIKVPWRYHQKHCFRDIQYAMGQPMRLDKIDHSAGADAAAQGRHLLFLLNQLKELPNYGKYAE